MQVEITVPMIGESVTEAVVGSLLVKSGSYVYSGEELLELETDKVNQALYAAESGEVHFTVSSGETVKVGQKLGFIETDAKAPEKKTAEVKKEEAKKPVVDVPLPKASEEGARKMAEDFIKTLDTPSIPKKEESNPIREDSVGKTRKKMSGLRKTIASKLVEVKNKTAMLTTFNEVDMSAVMTIRAKEKEDFEKRHGVKLGFMSFFVKAAVAALKEHPMINSYIEGDEIVTFHSYDIGVAVSTDKGLFVPVIKDCDKKSFGQIEQEILLQAKKAREGSTTIEDLKGGSFTITNGGVFGSLLSTPILNPPQSAILGMHSIVKRPIAVDDEVVIRPMMYLALSYDHRIVDGKDAVLFLIHIKEILEDPARLLLDL
jgi:2-oxoglutarate dehydrogenase E2 component (dihydrolipoamide succinyltransferase)